MSTSSISVRRYIPVALGVLLFGLGLLILRLNPYWRSEPGMPGDLDHHVYAWNALGHVVCFLGMVLFFGGVVFCLSHLFRTRWLYWLGTAAVIVAWLFAFGISNRYSADFTWTREAGIANFHVETHSWVFENPVWQTLVRWQVEAEFDNWLRTGPRHLKHTDASMEVKVISLIPIAAPAGLSHDGPEWPNTEWEN